MLSEIQREVHARWPAAAVQGDGPFAVVVACYANCGVWLYPTVLEAKSHLYTISENGCGDVRCTCKHRLIKIESTVPNVVEEIGPRDRRDY